ALDEEYVQEDKERSEHGPAADAVAQIQFGDPAAQKLARLGGLIAVLRPQPAAQALAVVMQDVALQRVRRPRERGALGMAVLDEGQAAAAQQLVIRRIDAGAQGPAVDAIG